MTFIILINYNGYADTLECVNSIFENENSEYRIIIVDNGSNSNDVEQLLKLETTTNKVKVIVQENLGFSGGNNVGIKYALEHGADYICLLNNDTTVEKNFLSELINVFKLCSNVGAVCPIIYDYYDKDNITYMGGYINYKNGRTCIYGMDIDLSGRSMELQKTDFATGCCLLMPHDAIEQVGLLCEDYFLYYEDSDYSLKIREKYDIYLQPKAKIYHKESVSTGNMSDLKNYYLARNRLFFIKNSFVGVQKVKALVVAMLSNIKNSIKNRNSVYLIGTLDFFRKKIGRR